MSNTEDEVIKGLIMHTRIKKGESYQPATISSQTIS